MTDWISASGITGPLRVHPRNPLYFTDDGGKAIYLGGHQVFNDIQDSAWKGDKDRPVVMDWAGHIEFMKKRGLNYLRNWITFSTGGGPGSLAGPLPYACTGPGEALDGKARFDLEKFDEAYFRRLHDRFRLAGEAGIAVSVMLFEVYGFNATGKDPQIWKGNVFNGRNNVNGIDVDSNGDSIGLEFFFAKDPRLERLQREYVKKVMDTVRDLPNVLFEIANECGAVAWQRAMTEFIHEYEAKRGPMRHLVLVSPGGVDVRGGWLNLEKNVMLECRPDVIAVTAAWGDFLKDPPANEEGRPAIMDRDHLDALGSRDVLLPWKAFTRGYHYSLYDHPFEQPEDEAPAWDLARRNVGALVSYSRRFADLASARPHGDLSSTRYCLADPGRDYLVLQPDPGKAFEVRLEAGKYRCEWFRPETASVEKGEVFQTNGEGRAFTPPFGGPAVLLCAAESDPAPRPVEFHVSLQGDDAGTGRTADRRGADGPFATIEKARQAVRELRKTQAVPVRVVLHAGMYHLDRPLLFEPEDSGTEDAPITYAAAEGERVVLSGGRRIEGGRWGEANGHRAWIADIPEVKAGTWRFRQLFVNGERRPRTRLPRKGEYQIEALPDVGVADADWQKPVRRFVYSGTDIQRWHDLPDVEVVAPCRWVDNRLPVKEVDLEKRVVTFDRSSRFNLVELYHTKPSTYWVENVLEALDTPGEWYLDRSAGRLCYLPEGDEDPATAELVAPRLPQVLRVTGRQDAPVQFLRFDGIVFAHTEWQPPADWSASAQAAVDVPGAFFFANARRCAVTRCGVEHAGTYAIEVAAGCQDIEVSRNRLTDLGGGGVKVGHDSRHTTVEDNEIAHGGRVFLSAVGIWVGHSAGNAIVHNHIQDLHYSGISVGWQWDFKPSRAVGNVIEENHIHDLGHGLLSDMGGIYTLGVSPGTRLRQNMIHDVQARAYGGWGIYPDEGSSEILIEDNLAYRCSSAPFFAHMNRDITVRNNVFALGEGCQVERAGAFSGPEKEYLFERNIVYYRQGQLVGYWDDRNRNFAFQKNLYWNASGAPVTFSGKTLAEWQAAGQDKETVIADPLFVDPEHGDFRLKPGSPAARIGFVPWDPSTAGPRAPAPAAKHAMLFPGAGWQRVAPESQGIDGKKLAAAMEQLGHGLRDHGGAGTVFIARNGNEVWAGPDCDKEYQIYSATKSVTGTVLGLLIQDGKATPDTPAKDFEPALAREYGGVTLRHFATMTSGYDSAGGSYEFDAEGRGDSWNAGPPAPPLFPPGSKFRYWDDAMSQFGNVLTRAAGAPLDRVFKERVADPIGMTRWRWVENDTPAGKALCWTGGICTSSRELARFGHLFLNRGSWSGRRLVDASWVDQATSVQVPATVPNDALPRSRGAGVYGFNWWVNGVKPDGRRLWPGAPPRTYYANGLHNNVCIVVPEWDMVVARTNGGKENGSANTPPDVDEVWSGFFGRLAEAVEAR